MTYALAFTALVLLAPGMAVGTWAWTMERIEQHCIVTSRGWTVAWALLATILIAWITLVLRLPSPFPGG